MSKYKILYNPMSNNGQGETDATALDNLLSGNELEYVDVTAAGDVKDILAVMEADEKLIISGGDGTLNHFLNDIDGVDVKNEVFFFATGTGNDFLSSVGVV